MPEHPPEHRVWVEALPAPAAAALADGQLKAWPPAAIWRRLVALCVDLSSAAKAFAAFYADRVYPHADSAALPRHPAIALIARDMGVTRKQAHRARDELEEHGWLDVERFKGAAPHMRLTVPGDVVREDGLLSEERATRREGRLRRRLPEPVSTGHRSRPPTGPGSRGRRPPEPVPTGPRGVSPQDTPKQEAAMPTHAAKAEEENPKHFAPRIESEEEAAARRAAWTHHDPL